jgi:hypothetical protein
MNNIIYNFIALSEINMLIYHKQTKKCIKIVYGVPNEN